MPILFIHGVAIRTGEQPEWETLQRITQGSLWPEVQVALRQHVAPALNAADPDAVDIGWVYWGDLGAKFAHGGRFQGSRQSPLQVLPGRVGQLDARTLAARLERLLRAQTPVDLWPELVEACWAVTQDTNALALISSAAVPAQWALAQAAVKAKMGAGDVPLPQWWGVQRRQNVRRTMVGLRRPLEDFVPFFIGDVLEYIGGRGTPQAPGPIMVRVLDGLRAAWKLAQQQREPLVVLTHSMGGQLLYDALTSFVPTAPDLTELRVEVWCAAASQVGLFKELGMFYEDQQEGGTALMDLPLLGTFWNVWSYSDLLSFRAEGIIGGVQDTPFPLSGRLQDDHLGYLQHPAFYRMLAARVRVQLQMVGGQP